MDKHPVVVWITPAVSEVMRFCVRCFLTDGFHFIFVNIDKTVSNTVLQISPALSLAANQVASSGESLCLFPSLLAIGRSVKFVVPSSYLAP